MVDSVYKVATRPQNSKAEMVMEDSNVVGATGGIVGVIRRAGATSSMDTGGAKVGDAETGGIASIGSSPYFVGTGVDCACSACGGTGGATMGEAPGGVE